MNRHVAFDDLVNALRCGQSACPCAHNGSGTYMVHCPAHDDTNPSLSVTDKDGTVLFYCHANCAQDAVIAALRTRNLWPTPEMRDSSVNGEKVEASSPGVTVEALADLKKLPVEYLLELGLSNFKQPGIPTVRIPYRDQDGNEIAVRFRHALEGKRFSWRKGDHVALYGLDRLNQIRAAGWVLLVEGESDCWTLWMYGLPALGIPGKSTWRELWARWLDGLAVFVWEEPAAEDLVKKIAVDIPDVRVIQAPDGVKDPSDAHLLGHDLPSYIDRLKASSVPAHAIVRSQTDARTVELERQAATVLTATEPLKLIVKAIRAVGYGGKIKPALIVYLAVTSRLLYLREGGMLVHLLLLSSAFLKSPEAERTTFLGKKKRPWNAWRSALVVPS